MTLIAEIVTEIINRLEPIKDELNCSVTRLDKAALSRPRSGNEVFIGFDGRNASEPQFLDTIVQVDEIDFEVMISSMELRTQEAAYPIMERIRQLLTGFYPTENCYDPLYMVGKEKLLRNFIDDGLWVYQQIYRLKSEFIQTENLDG